MSWEVKRPGLVADGQAIGVGEEGMLLPLAYVVVVSVIIFLHYHRRGGMSILVLFVYLLVCVWLKRGRVPSDI